MIKKLLLSIGVFLCCIGFVYPQAMIKGVISDNEGNALGIAQGQVFLIQEGVTIRDVFTDGNGAYQFPNLQSGTYDVRAVHLVSGKDQTVAGIRVNPDAIVTEDIKINLSSDATVLQSVTITHRAPIIDPNSTVAATTIDGKQLQKSPGRDLTKALASADGVSSVDGDIKSVRGNRSDGQVVIIDGVRVRGSASVAMQSMDAAQLIQGGIPAEYGDGTSFQVYSTRGVPKNFASSVEFRGSVDGYNNFLGAVSVSGPIVRSDSNKKARIGFMLSGEGYFNQDNRPMRGGTWRATDETIQSLRETPLQYSLTDLGASSSPANYLLEDAFEKKRVRQNAENWGYIVQGKIDIQPIKSTDVVKANSLRLSLNGSYDYGKGKNWSLANSMFNVANNSVYDNSTLRLFARVNHMVVNSTDEKKLLKNLTYDINVSYTKYNYSTYDNNFKDNLFAYGHIGKFTTSLMDRYQLSSFTDTNGIEYDDVWVMNRRNDPYFVAFTPGEYNPDLAQYNRMLLDNFGPETVEEYFGIPYNKVAYQQFGGLLNGESPSTLYSMYYLPGIRSSGYQKSEITAWGAKASLSMNLGNHEIKLGFEFDRPTERGYSISAAPLWTLMRGLVNTHFAELDFANYSFVGEDSISFGLQNNLDAQSTFDRKLREKLGYDPNGTDWIDVDNLDPSTFDVSMLSAEDLLVGTTATGGSMIQYYGYDYTGKNKYNKKTDITDFFNAKDANGQRTYNIGAYEPVYMAMYLQDRFSIRTLVFNVGVRIDRFDANQSVLRDPYLFRPAHTVGSIKEDFDVSSNLFVANAQDDWVVYVNQRDEMLNLDESNIVGYRSGDTWYDANGQEVTDPDALLGANGGPALVSAIDNTLISKVDEKAFMDYETQWSIMPRLSFSFPVSTKSRFTAHYNIITSRPTNLRLEPISYLFVEKYGKNQNNVINNPNLKSQKSIDYEVGFAQALGDNAAINITAYYSEKRNMIQSYRYTQAYPSTYYSYANMDFGTVQGLSLSYVMREIKNISLRAGYTLQFAKGTGSTAGSNLAIIQSGQPNLRTLTNLEFDQRHRLNMSVSYTSPSGQEYDGPKSVKKLSDSTKKEIRWFEGFGVSLVFSAASGLPYSKSSVAYSGIVSGLGSSRLSGTINGSHRPWTYQCDLRIDRTFKLGGKTKDDGKKRKTTDLMVYVDVTNLFNFKNVLSVYTYTGNADDDGYLTASEYEQQIKSQLSVESYKWYYGMRVKNPYNYSAPTRVSLGFMFLF
ncbi:MAG: hypothetical protein LBV02_02580 [Bacteroidales bacterium]|nr:hypothetical protein [Bacteroidales bacterium]